MLSSTVRILCTAAIGQAAWDPTPDVRARQLQGVDPGSDPTPEPTDEPGPDPTSEPGPDPTSEPGPDPTAEPGLDPTPEPGPDPTPEPGPDPTPQPGPDPTPFPSAGIQLQSNVSSFCVDLPGGDASNGAMLWMWDCYGGETQQFAFQDGQLVYAPDPSKCVDLLGGDSTNGNQLGLWDCYQGDSQMWGFDEDWGTFYLASSKASDAEKCVQIGGENKGDPLVIWDCTGEPQQIWKKGPPMPHPVDPTAQPGPDPTDMPGPDPTPDPGPPPTPAPMAGVQLQSNVSSLCVDLPGGDASNGMTLQMLDCYGGETQQFAFQDGQLVYVADPSKCVDLLGGDASNGNQIGLWDCYQGDSQMWGFDEEWGTFYLASSKASDAEKCVQIGGENQFDPLVIWDCTGEPQQIWKKGPPPSSVVAV